MQITGAAKQNGNSSSEAAPLRQKTQTSSAAKQNKEWILNSSLLDSQIPYQLVDTFDPESNG